MILEPLHGITYACSQTAAVDFLSNKLDFSSGNGNNDGKEATGQGFLQFFIGIGSVIGLVFGGYAEDSYGPRIMYRISALFVSIGCMLFVAGITGATTLPTRQIRHQAIPKTEERADDDIEIADDDGYDFDDSGGIHTVVEMTLSLSSRAKL